MQQSSHATRVLDRLLEPVGRCLSLRAARALASLRADAEVQARVDELAQRCNEGMLTAEERAEYEAYVMAASVVAILQAKARGAALFGPVMDGATRDLVRRRAGRRCECCQLHETDDPLFSFHVEHVIARQHRGPDSASNLALACHEDNLRKGPNLTGIDPITKKLTRLFNPRRHKWSRHFRWDGSSLVGRTDVGRTTVTVLGMNLPHRITLREALIAAARFPPP